MYKYKTYSNIDDEDQLRKEDIRWKFMSNFGRYTLYVPTDFKIFKRWLF